MNGYMCFYKKKQTEIYANTTLEAQEKAAKFFKAKKSWEVTVVLAEKNGKQITHTADF
jgi:hypothetical protein